MHEKGPVWVRVTKSYRDFRNTQTFLNRFVWSSELCYSYFLDIFEKDLLSANIPVGDLFNNLPIQAWYKNKKGTSKYNLKLHEHNEVVRTNQINICRSAIILYNSYFDEYLKVRLLPKDSKWTPFTIRLVNNQLRFSRFKIDPIKIFKADICRLLRNTLVHNPDEKFPDIKTERSSIKTLLVGFINKSYLIDHFRFQKKFLYKELDKALNEVIDSATTEKTKASQKGVELPFEYFFMLYTFTNYDALALELEKVLFHDHFAKTEFNQVSLKRLKDGFEKMIAEPSVYGYVFDAITKLPIELCELKVKSNPASCTCDGKGYYCLTPNLPEGINYLEVSSSKHEKLSIEVIVERNKSKQLDIELFPKQTL